MLYTDGIGSISTDITKKIQQKEENLTLPWVEKFRPKTLTDVISHETITSTLQKFIKIKRVFFIFFYILYNCKSVWVTLLVLI